MTNTQGASSAITSKTLGASTTSYSFDYTVEDAADDQEDLLGATATTILNTVTLKFNHLLSQVNFAV